MEKLNVNFNPIKPKGRKILSRKTALGRPIPVITGMGGVLRDIESKNAQKIDELSKGILAQGKVISDEISKQSAITSNAIDGVKRENVALYNELGSHILANNPHGITKETIGLNRVDNTADFEKPVSIAVGIALDQKADKEELKAIEERIEESIKDQEKIKDDISKSMNIIGGVGGESLVGGKKGQVLKKVSNKDGDYTWQDDSNTKVHNELEERDAENCHPISAIDGLETALESKYDASNPDGYISGITSSMVTDALGYTPYNSSNPSNYQTDTEVAGAVSVETGNRELADNGLQQQIDAITASSDVKDIVGTYAALQAYDTSTLGNKDIIKVLQDETHDDETTYYRWNSTTETFTLIGEEGPYYTKAAADAEFVPQTRTVNGKALSSNISLDASDVGALPDSTVIPTVNNSTITITQGGVTKGSFTLNQASGDTIALDAGGADTDLSNLTSTGKNIGNWSSNVTNCITYIPQDIKLELSSGTLTLKAGSKVYVPNGSGVFDEVVVNSDVTRTQSGTSTTYFCFYKQSNNTIYIGDINASYSGSNAPTLSGSTGYWYDTTNNIVKRTTDSGATWTSDYSLPFAIITVSDGAISSIDKVFNGFGYIGSTVFALPGIKGLIPNGRNDDGTLKSTEFVLDSVKTFTDTTTTATYINIGLNSNNLIDTWSYYNEKSNRLISYSDGGIVNCCACGCIHRTVGVIDGFNVKTVFHALDWNDKGTIAGWSMPSNKSIDLTLGSSGATYTAPANGYFYLRKNSTAVGQYMTIYSSSMQIQHDCGASGNGIGIIFPAKAGQTVTIEYNLGGSTRSFRFVYLDGEVE